MRRTTGLGYRAARDIPPVLAGTMLARCGDSVAVDVAAAHLEALGCRGVPAPARRTGDGPRPSAGEFALHPPGNGRPVPGPGLGVRCGIDWAGPVNLPVADEAGVQAACGVMHVHGRKSGAPAALCVDYASATAGVLAAQGVLAVLLARQRGMDLRQVRTSVAQAALLAVSQYLAAATAPEDRAEPHLPGGPPFTSADGVRFEIEALDAQPWSRFWASLGAEPAAIARGWGPFQRRYSTATCPLPEQLHQASAAHSFAVVAGAAVAAGISILAVRDRVDRAAARHASLRPPWRITPLGAPAPAASPPGPAQAGALPLAGLVVIESCRRVQGPLAGHLLRLLGAQVIRIEPPGGDPLRGVPPMAGDCSARFLALNRGKQVLELDLAGAAGRRALRELVAEADVFLHNWAPGKAGRWDLDAERLCALRPGLVYAWASGWGDALGPAPPLGTDFMVQAHSGLAALVVPDGEPPAPSLMTLTDVLGGAVCAQGVLAGLLTRARTGRGQRVDSSLLSAASVLLTRSSRPSRPGPSRPGPSRSGRGRATGMRASAVCTDLARLATDPRFTG
ncbi:MAG TPA: CoA transferase, partial [Pseudonocardiaceae bacterium]|nr:CoA transferase [Pseudonocardiaceae bacterium]